jgi:hypothetical protein
VSARQLKEELSNDQINRKLDSTYERLNHRMSYLEARLDVSVAKIQVITEIFYFVLAQHNTKQAENKMQLEDSSLLRYPEDGGKKYLQNCHTYIPIYMMSFPRILESSLVLL